MPNHNLWKMNSFPTSKSMEGKVRKSLTGVTTHITKSSFQVFFSKGYKSFYPIQPDSLEIVVCPIFPIKWGWGFSLFGISYIGWHIISTLSSAHNPHFGISECLFKLTPPYFWKHEILFSHHHYISS